MLRNVVVMAAGKGTRMRSARPKVLHLLAGRRLLQHVLDAVAGLGPERVVVVVGHGADEVERTLRDEGRGRHAGGPAATGAAHDDRHPPQPVFVRQEPQLGTGHAVQQAVPQLLAGGTTLVLNGDVPLVATATLAALVAACDDRRLALLTATPADPGGYGRIVRDTADATRVVAIVEEKDASPAQRRLGEIYTGAMAAPTDALVGWLGRIGRDNAAGEHYLTDAVGLAGEDGVQVLGVAAADETEILGVNSAAQLAALERRHQRAVADRLMDSGVRLADPARLDVRGRLECGRDVEIDVGCVFEGEVVLGDEVTIGAHCVVRNARLEAGARLLPFSHVDGDAAGASVGQGARVGPFARLRAGAVLGDDVHVGNFVEVKNARLGAGAKANHLAYLGDADVGARVNVGAGSITANYDGASKHRTTIGDDASIGSNCVLVAPVAIGAGATIGAGSTITRDAPAGELTVARPRPVTVAGWKRPKKR